MEGTPLEDYLGIIFTAISAAGATLTSAIAYLFKLYYVDTKAALNDCKDNHKLLQIEYGTLLKTERAERDVIVAAEREECNKRIEKHESVINQLNQRIDYLYKEVVMYMKGEKNEETTNSFLHKPTI